MIEILPCSPLLYCAHCQAALTECPEMEYEDWIVRCFECGAKNMIDSRIVNAGSKIALAVVGWRA